MILLYSKIHKYKEEFELSFINNALKTSAIACMTAITVATSVVTVGGVIYGPKIARSVIDASSGVARASNLAGNVMLSADESVKIINANLGTVCKAASVSMEAVSSSLEAIADKIKDPKDKNKEDIERLMGSIIRTLDVITLKAEELNVKEINESITKVRTAVGQLNDGIKDIFIECENGKRININSTLGLIRFLIESFGATKKVALKNPN